MSDAKVTQGIKTIVEEMLRQGLERMEECNIPLDKEPVGTYFLLVGLKIALLDPELGAILEDALMLDQRGEAQAQASVARLGQLVKLAQTLKEGNGA